MKDWTARRARYQRDTSAVQLGGLASNLSRIAWCAARQDLAQASPLFRESKYFTEWAAPSCLPEQQGLLAEVQSRLAFWERGWGTWVEPGNIAEQAQQWSTRLLESAGLSGVEGTPVPGA
jgi:hypothetical protein